MKNYDVFIGIDVSKLTLDICGIDNCNEVRIKHSVIKNSVNEIKSYFKKVIKNQRKNIIVGFENTGIYGALVASVLNELCIDYSQLPSLEISKSKGISRGKSDKIDALQIAQYLLSHRFKIKLSTIAENHITEMRLLYTHREKIIKSISQYQREFENKNFLPKEIQKDLIKSTNSILKNLNNNLEKIEKKLSDLIKENKTIEKNFNLIKSVPGVGKQTAIYLLLVTKNFTAFKEARQLACYAGVAPFPYQSGSSINGRNKVNNLADKKLKSLLNMCALSANKYDYDLKEYFEKKVTEGKNKMLVLNNIRNKILSRVFAVINRQEPYVNLKKFAA
ncbi:MAG: IS110 family transposase [Crocinitomicaceae bacterium]|nr:IS110 family transposase [Crocinitomicaceae bacterium]